MGHYVLVNAFRKSTNILNVAAHAMVIIIYVKYELLKTYIDKIIKQYHIHTDFVDET